MTHFLFQEGRHAPGEHLAESFMVHRHFPGEEARGLGTRSWGMRAAGPARSRTSVKSSGGAGPESHEKCRIAKRAHAHRYRTRRAQARRAAFGRSCQGSSSAPTSRALDRRKQSPVMCHQTQSCIHVFRMIHRSQAIKTCRQVNGTEHRPESKREDAPGVLPWCRAHREPSRRNWLFCQGCVRPANRHCGAGP
jgi:hypothetical protein